MFGSYRLGQRLRRRLRLRMQDNGPLPRAFDDLPLREQLIAMVGIIRSQLPKHNPDHEKLPELADLWFERYASGYDVSHWYTADPVASKKADR
jgi:hypothetical protein